MTTNKKRSIAIPLFTAAIIICAAIYGITTRKHSEYFKNNGFVFGTIYEITYEADADMETEIKNEFERVNMSLSPFEKSSIISHINNNKSVDLDTLFTNVFTLAMTISEQTGGAFDITVAPLVNAWGFGFKNKIEVSQHTIDSLMEFIGYKKVALNGGKVIKSDPRTMLDCSAIAKGYACDVVADLFNRKGITNYMINIGGEIVVKGMNPKGSDWRIGINKPIDDSLSVNNEIEAVLGLTDIAMATSGNYRNFYYKDGKKYAHTIDPRTGTPVQHSVLSATVLAPHCATADAYATSFMVMGLDEAKSFCKHHPEIMAYLIYSDSEGNNKTYCTPNLKSKLK